MMDKLQVVLIESNPSVANTLSLALSEKFEIITANNGQKGLKEVILTNPFLVILDTNIIDISALDVTKKLKSIGAKAPILILGKDNTSKIKVSYYEAGAEDYLSKPFSIGELKAKLEIIRNRFELNFYPKVKSTNLILNKENRSVVRDGGNEIILRSKEYAILEYLHNNLGQVVSRQTLTTYAWKDSTNPWSNAVDVHIKYLRDKIDKPFKKPIITTIHGRGYRLEAE